MGRLVDAFWILGNSAGPMNGDGSRKLLLHSTEGSSIESAVGAYRTNNSWPHLTVDLVKRRIAQHNNLSVAARSLQNDKGGEETNRDGSILIQIEVVGFAEIPRSFGATADLRWFGEQVIGPIAHEYNIPLQSTVDWVPYPQSYGERKPQRLQGSAWDEYSGILGHQHAPENDHGDPGSIDIETILDAALGQGDWFAMATKQDLKAAVEEVVRELIVGYKFPPRFLGHIHKDGQGTGLVFAFDGINMLRRNLTGDSFLISQYEATGFVKQFLGDGHWDFYSIGEETMQLYHEVDKLP